MRFYYLLPFLFTFVLLQADIPVVLVSVAPHKFFVEKIAKDAVEVYLMVPAGASSHTYEPTPKQILTASKGKIWFRIGEPFEERAIQALTSHHPSLKIVDLRKHVDLIVHGGCSHRSCCQGGIDLHFWLSARQAIIQSQTITDALCETFPEKADFFRNNLTLFTSELKELDATIKAILAPISNRKVFVSHPAYAYFCRDYSFEQYSIEVEGKDVSPREMTRLLGLAKDWHIRTIFVQMQYNNKAAKLFGEAIGANLVTLNPYSEQYMASMLEIAHAFSK